MTRRHISGAVLAFLVGVASASAGPAADTDHLRFRRPIDIPPRDAAELVAVPLDAAILDATSDGFPDLRILGADGKEVARVIRRAATATTRAVRRTFTIDMPRLEPLPGGGLAIEFTIDPARHPRPIDGLRLETPLGNFEQRVRVQRRDADGTWQAVGDETLLYDYSQFMDTRQVEIALPAEPGRLPGGTWRITVDETTIEQRSTLAELVRTLDGARETGRQETRLVASQPFRIDAIRAWHVEDVAEVRGVDAVERPLAAVRIEEERQEKRTRIRVPTGREPVTGLRLVVADRNFARAVRIERPLQPPADRPPRREAADAAVVLGSGRVHRIDLRGIRQESLAITIPESRLPEYEIVIDNADSQPLDVTGVVAIGPAYEAVFLAAPDGSYALAYGGVAAAGLSFPQPHYDTGAIETALAAGMVPARAGAGPVAERSVTPAEKPSQPLLARILGNHWVIGGTIAVLAALLAVSLVSAARRIDAAAEPPERGRPD